MRKLVTLLLCLVMVIAVVPMAQAVEFTYDTEFTTKVGEQLEIYTRGVGHTDPCSNGLVCVVENESILKVFGGPSIMQRMVNRMGFYTTYTCSFIVGVEGLAPGTTSIMIRNVEQTAEIWKGTVTVSADMSSVTVEPIEDQVYTGKKIKPELKLTLNDTVLKEGTDYKVSYKDNKEVGVATITVTGIDSELGGYTGSVDVTFNINPKAPKFSSLKVGKKQLTPAWKKVKKATGYQIEYSRYENFKSSKKVTVNSGTAVNTVLKSLKSGKTYYVRVRTIQKVGKTKFYSEWTKPLSRKVK